MGLATVELEDGHMTGCAEDVEDQKHAGDGYVDVCGRGEAELGYETGVGGPVLECVRHFVMCSWVRVVVPLLWLQCPCCCTREMSNGVGF